MARLIPDDAPGSIRRLVLRHEGPCYDPRRSCGFPGMGAGKE